MSESVLPILPVLQKGEPFYKYYNRLNEYYLNLRYDKRKKILQFINEWMFGLTKSKYYNKLTDFKNVFYRELPNDNISKEYLKEHFVTFNNEFDLELEYDARNPQLRQQADDLIAWIKKDVDPNDSPNWSHPDTDKMNQLSLNPLALSVYVLTNNSEGKLTTTNLAVKQNLKSYRKKFKTYIN